MRGMRGRSCRSSTLPGVQLFSLIFSTSLTGHGNFWNLKETPSSPWPTFVTPRMGLLTATICELIMNIRLYGEHVTLLSPQPKVKLTAKSRNRATFQTHTYLQSLEAHNTNTQSSIKHKTNTIMTTHQLPMSQSSFLTLETGMQPCCT